MAVLILSGLVLCACGASGQKLLGRPVHKPISIFVRVGLKASQTNDGGGLAALVDSLISGLEERGLQGRLYAALDDDPPPPRIDLVVKEWDAGDDGLREGGAVIGGIIGASMASSGSGKIVVDCSVFRERNKKPVFRRRYERFLFSFKTSAGAGDSLGEDILDDVMTE